MKKGIDYPAIGVVSMCHDGTGNYLFGLRGAKSRDEVATWSPLGTGGVDHGDTVEATVMKEVKEETCAEAFNVEQIGWYETFRDNGDECKHWVQFVYRVQVDPATVQIGEPEKCQKIRWCALEDFPEPMHSLAADFLERFRDKL